jgi:dienelactone hydrolase
MPRLDAGAVRRVLELPEPPTDVSIRIVDSTRLDGCRRLRLEIGCADGDTMPAFLLVPDDARDAPGVVVFHQHAAQWHLGKSEVCGLAGDPAQAFGPALVDRGLVVLAPDAVGFEDRRRTAFGVDEHLGATPHEPAGSATGPRLLPSRASVTADATGR